MRLNEEEFWALKMRIQHGHAVAVKIASGSMSPLIKVGDTLQVWDKKHYQPFDVVIYHHDDGRLICHYIWQKSRLDPKTYLLRSLKGSAFDLPVLTEKILGYNPHNKITVKIKILIFIKLLGQRIRQGCLG